MKPQTAGLIVTTSALGAMIAVAAGVAGLLTVQLSMGPEVLAQFCLLIGVGLLGVRRLVAPARAE